MPFEVDANEALLAGAWTIAATALIWLEILRVRRRQARETRISRAVIARWHPLLSLASFGIPPDDLPPLQKDEHAAFLKLWVYLQTSLRGDARTALSEIARRLHCDTLALRMLASRSRSDKLLATVVAGHLGLQPALKLLLLHAEAKDSVLSLQALHAVLRISPELAATLIPLCVQRADWPVTELLPGLRDSSPWIAGPLLAAFDSPHEHERRRSLQLAKGLRIPIELPLQQRLLSQSPAALLAESLPLVDQATLLPDVRACLVHADNRVRAAAVEALVRLGDAGDLATMAAMLGDPSWRVRNAAAHAIVSLPGGGLAALRRVADECDDRYGRNMAEHVLAEERLAAA